MTTRKPKRPRSGRRHRQRMLLAVAVPALLLLVTSRPAVQGQPLDPPAALQATAEPKSHRPPQGWEKMPAVPMSPIDPTSAVPIGCGQSVTGDTTGAANNANAYSCVPWWPETGPENVYELALNGVTDLDAVLSEMAVDLDLFLLTGTSSSSCIAYGDNAVSVRGLPAGTYYLVVDGYLGAAGVYRLSAWCPLDPTPTPSPTPTTTPTPRASRIYLPVLLARG